MTDYQTMAFVVALMVHTGALFYWGGGVRQMLKDHANRITRLEDAAAKGD